MENSTNPDVHANQALLIEIIKAEAFVPLHLKIEAVELVSNERGQWEEGPKVFMGTIQNEVDQSKPEAYNLDGSKADKPEKVQYSEMTLETLRLWFNETNAEAILKAKRLNGDAIENAAELHAEVIKLLPKDKRSLQISTLDDRIKFS